MGLQAQTKSGIFSKLSQRLRSIFVSSKKSQSKDTNNPNFGKSIEVFDVLIKTSKRLQFFDLKKGNDFLTSNGYMEKMQALFNAEPNQ